MKLCHKVSLKSKQFCNFAKVLTFTNNLMCINGSCLFISFHMLQKLWLSNSISSSSKRIVWFVMMLCSVVFMRSSARTKLITKTPDSVILDGILSLLLTFNRLYTFFSFFNCWLWASKCKLKLIQIFLEHV